MAEYRMTNEQLGSIIRGLDPQGTDIILAACGSGDQTFALAEFSRQVIAVDKDSEQIKHAKKLVELLRKGQYEDFLRERHCATKQTPIADLLDREENSTNYFFLDRLQGIARNLGVISLKHSNILTVMESEVYTKLYLPNILGYESDSYLDIQRYMALIYERTPSGGLIYASNGTDFTANAESCGLIADEEMTKRARSQIPWTPIVWRR